jgi:hypothetical protein
MLRVLVAGDPTLEKKVWNWPKTTGDAPSSVLKYGRTGLVSQKVKA